MHPAAAGDLVPADHPAATPQPQPHRARTLATQSTDVLIAQYARKRPSRRLETPPPTGYHFAPTIKYLAGVAQW